MPRSSSSSAARNPSGYLASTRSSRCKELGATDWSCKAPAPIPQRSHHVSKAAMQKQRSSPALGWAPPEKAEHVSKAGYKSGARSPRGHVAKAEQAEGPE